MDTSNGEALEIVAYTAWGYGVELVPAWLKRDWMDLTDFRFAYHCLPMTLANQSGWFVIAPTPSSMATVSSSTHTRSSHRSPAPHRRFDPPWSIRLTRIRSPAMAAHLPGHP